MHTMYSSILIKIDLLTSSISHFKFKTNLDSLLRQCLVTYLEMKL